MKANKVVKVDLRGGWLALFQSPAKKIEEVLKVQNDAGWNLIFVLPPNPNPLFYIWGIFCLVCTLGFYMPLPAYMLIMEKTEK